MTKGAPESDHAEISAAERWELLERIRNSREFKRALRLRELLLYIGTQTVKLSITSIRELASQCSGTASWLLCLLTFSPLAMIRR